MIKGLTAGTVNTGVAILLGQSPPRAIATAGAMALGFASYGFSLVLYVHALRVLGTARAGNYFSTAPFIGAALGVFLWGEQLSIQLIGCGLLMAAGLGLHFTEHHAHRHVHDGLEHEHRHVHDEHHAHAHRPDDPTGEPHSHPHGHEPLDRHAPRAWIRRRNGRATLPMADTARYTLPASRPKTEFHRLFGV